MIIDKFDLTLKRNKLLNNLDQLRINQKTLETELKNIRLKIALIIRDQESLDRIEAIVTAETL